MTMRSPLAGMLEVVLISSIVEAAIPSMRPSLCVREIVAAAAPLVIGRGGGSASEGMSSMQHLEDQSTLPYGAHGTNLIGLLLRLRGGVKNARRKARMASVGDGVIRGGGGVSKAARRPGRTTGAGGSDMTDGDDYEDVRALLRPLAKR